MMMEAAPSLAACQHVLTMMMNTCKGRLLLLLLLALTVLTSLPAPMHGFAWMTLPLMPSPQSPSASLRGRVTTVAAPSPTTARRRRRRRQFDKEDLLVVCFLATNDGDNDDDEWIAAENVQVFSNDGDGDDEDWIPDRVKAQQCKEQARIYAEKIKSTPSSSTSSSQQEEQEQQYDSKEQQERPSPYTDEEEDIIAAMGGKTFHQQRKRETGFLGDSTLHEIATDYSVPICYLADVLCMWGVPVPIDVNDRLGDLVTGEQAFSLLEAVNSLDVAALHDRYSNTNLLQTCYEWDIPLQDAFEMAVKEGWSLPFGVQTCLRVEQEDELIRVLGQEQNLMARMEDADDDYIDID